VPDQRDPMPSEQKASDTERRWTLIHRTGQFSGPDFPEQSLDVVELSALQKEKAEREAMEQKLLACAERLENQNLEGDGPADLTAATVRAVKAQGVRDAVAALTDESNREESST
jgi:hypothetical protein